MPDIKTVYHYLEETPESLYFKDQLQMKYETQRRNMDPELAHFFDRVDRQVDKAVFGI